jgi:outer membrane protein OmpA-like peptidoglycan-associated protein
MKKNVFQLRFSHMVLLIFLFLCFSPQFSCASAPKSVDLIYDMSTQNLSVTINHQTLFASMHHIKYVEIKKNGMLISKNIYGTQPTGSIFTYTYNIPVQKGDVFEVTAICNLWGHKTSTLIIDATASVAEIPAAPKEAVVAPAPVAETPAAPKEAVVAPAPVAEKPMLETTTIALNVKFNTAKAVVEKKYHNDIKAMADFMKAHPGATAVIEGYTDNVDKFNEPEKNIKLSQARAESVRQYLIDNFGIDASRITAVGYGPAKPIASNDTEKGRQKNRRVQVVIETVQTK